MKRNCYTFIYLWGTICGIVLVGSAYGVYGAEKKGAVIVHVVCLCVMFSAWVLGLFFSIKDDRQWKREHPDDS